MTSSACVLTSADGVRLQEILDDLADRKDDSQQRSWYLHQDEHVISGVMKMFYMMTSLSRVILFVVVVMKYRDSTRAVVVIGRRKR